VQAAAGVGDADAAARAFRQWLSRTSTRWLLVLDDLADPGDLHELWPLESVTGRTVITTRRRDASLTTRGALIPVGVFTPAEAAEYLADRLGHDRARLAGAGDLAQELGYKAHAKSLSGECQFDVTHLRRYRNVCGEAG
jgi:hypothetical protein